jgi:glycosyltransferase involved in cell wall biosynthesis
MKVCLINTSDTGGGAAVACRRQLKALITVIDIQMLVAQKKTQHPAIIEIAHNWYSKSIAQVNFLIERLPFIAFKAKNKAVRFAFSPANAGINIAKHLAVKQADILHLHWINSGFLSLKNLKTLFSLQKPMVLTLHDMWAFTGGCHYASECNGFTQHCGNCPILKNPKENDISRKGWLAKKEIYQQNNRVTFVACSEWMAEMARKSTLLKDANIVAIPNPIDTEIYKPLDKITLRKEWNIDVDTKIILFGAANINDQRKGMKYLIAALNLLKENNPTNLNIEIILFGKNTESAAAELPFKVKSLPVITSEEELTAIYNLADVFVLPSLEDNLPNMVMEALACSVPVVAFNQGGIPEMVSHQQNGYIAQYQSTADLQAGIDWVLNNKTIDLKNNARQKVLKEYSESVIAQKYQLLYQSISQ